MFRDTQFAGSPIREAAEALGPPPLQPRFEALLLRHGHVQKCMVYPLHAARRSGAGSRGGGVQACGPHSALIPKASDLEP